MSTARWLTLTFGYLAVNEAMALSKTLYRSPVRSQMVISPEGAVVTLGPARGLDVDEEPGAQPLETAATPLASTAAAPAPRSRARRLRGGGVKDGTWSVMAGPRRSGCGGES